ncbi:MAG TPA: DUF4336 domain-containing protein [Candidatus Acidoferrales bacterium]|nr:DUF4336 domain-containing protein [Candidatus Acidoferrales bacterium]
MEPLQRFADGIWIADGPVVHAWGFAFPTRTTVVRLSGGTLWIDSPVVATRAQADRVAALGRVEYLVSATPMHDWRLKAWAKFFPDAQVWKAESLLENAPAAWANDLDAVPFRGSIVLTETEFFHKPSRTAILADFVQNHAPKEGAPLRNALLKLGGALGGVPRDIRLSFAGKRRIELARESLRRILAWDFDKLILAHGDCVTAGAKAFVENAFGWLTG